MCLATITHDYCCPMGCALLKHGDLWCKLCLHRGCSFVFRQTKSKQTCFHSFAPLLTIHNKNGKINIKFHNNAKIQDYEHTKLLWPCDASLKWCLHIFHTNRLEFLGKPSLQQKVSLYATWFHWMLSEFICHREWGLLGK